MNFAGCLNIGLQAAFRRYALCDITIGNVLEGSYLASAGQPVKAIEGPDDEIVRCHSEIGFNLNDLSVENRFRLASFSGCGSDNFQCSPETKHFLIDPMQLRIVQPQRSNIRHVQAVLDHDLDQIAHESLRHIGTVDAYMEVTKKVARLRHSESPMSYRAAAGGPESGDSHRQ